MKPLLTCQRVFSWIYIDSVDEIQIWWQKLIKIVIKCFLPIIPVCALILVSVSFFKSLSIDIEQSLYSLFQIAASLISLNAGLVIYFTGYKISDVFRCMTKIYKTCNKNANFSEYIFFHSQIRITFY